jgi:cytochrome c553
VTRVVVLTIFTLIAIAVLSLRNGGTGKSVSNYFDLDQYSKKYHAEIALQKELAAPKIAEIVEEAEEVSKEPELVLTTESQIRGQKLFKKCITCHGPHGQGKKSQKAPKLAGQFSWYIADKIKQMQDGVWENKVMYPYIKNLSAQDRKDLGDFLSAYKW